MIIEERISLLQDDLDIASDVKPTTIHIADCRDEIQFLQYPMNSQMDRADVPWEYTVNSNDDGR